MSITTKGCSLTLTLTFGGVQKSVEVYGGAWRSMGRYGEVWRGVEGVEECGGVEGGVEGGREVWGV